MQLRHTYANGAKGKALFVETIGGGGGWFDYDSDGWPDIYLNQGGDPTTGDKSKQPSDALFRNLAGEKFVSVGRFARISEFGYSQGVAVGDFNNDGLADVYVTNLGPNTLWVNCGDGTFLDVSRTINVADNLWSVSAAWADLDLDGDLDLYVGNYCEYDATNPKVCLDREGRDTLCNPSDLAPQPDQCYLNNGDGTFAETSKSLGLFGDGNRALGVAIADFTGDKKPDVYVANDTTDNFLFVQQSDGKFIDEARLRGCAVDRAGGPQGSMGVAIADFDNNKMLDIYSTHFYEESNTLYANEGELGFQDVTAVSNLHRPTLKYLGFGTIFCDLNSDGKLELLIANGHVDHSQRAANPKMTAQLFTYDGKKRWEEVSQSAGDYFGLKRLGRAVADADFDRDGDIDVLIINENDPTVLLENTTVPDNGNWLQLELVGTHSNRDGQGCEITLIAGQEERYQQAIGGSSYAAAREQLITFALPSTEDASIDSARVLILWPSGKEQTLVLDWNKEYQVIEPR